MIIGTTVNMGHKISTTIFVQTLKVYHYAIIYNSILSSAKILNCVQQVNKHSSKKQYLPIYLFCISTLPHRYESSLHLGPWPVKR